MATMSLPSSHSHDLAGSFNYRLFSALQCEGTPTPASPFSPGCSSAMSAPSPASTQAALRSPNTPSNVAAKEEDSQPLTAAKLRIQADLARFEIALEAIVIAEDSIAQVANDTVSGQQLAAVKATIQSKIASLEAALKAIYVAEGMISEIAQQALSSVHHFSTVSGCVTPCAQRRLFVTTDDAPDGIPRAEGEARRPATAETTSQAPYSTTPTSARGATPSIPSFSPPNSLRVTTSSGSSTPPAFEGVRDFSRVASSSLDEHARSPMKQSGAAIPQQPAVGGVSN